MEAFIPLKEYLGNWSAPDARREPIARTVLALASAGKEIAALIARGPLAGEFGAEIGTNADGDTQQALDLLAHDLVLEAMHDAPVRWLLSEELDAPLLLRDAAPLTVAVDPLDGSSNIDTNVSVGTIFSIMPAEGDGDARAQVCRLQAGTRQVAAGYIIYGPQVALVLTLGEGTVIFTLDPWSRRFRLTQPAVEIPPATREFAINSSNLRNWDGHIRAYVDDCLSGEEGPHQANYNMRWIASLVAECHRIMSRGGIFLYPADQRRGYAQGRLRLVYECNPIALLVEQAGGAAITGTGRILELEPEGVHQRVPFIFGSIEEVRLVGKYYEGADRLHERPQLFRHRSVLRG